MNTSKRLERLEGRSTAITPIFITGGDQHPLNAVEFMGQQGGTTLRRSDGETEAAFKQRCEQYAVKHTQKGFTPVFFQIDMEGCGF